MKKPLQSEEQFLISTKGQLIGWGKKDVKNLISNANRARADGYRSKDELTYKEAECLFALEWLELLSEKGTTEHVVKRLNSRIAHVNYRHLLVHSSKGLPYWRRIANGDQIEDPELAIAYGVAHLISIGALQGLRSCSMRTCRKYFIGRPNAKWCSDTCGSKHRVTQMRKRNRS